ncbi:MAG TPA: Ku protein [Burkholderiaceae bacterium]|nr:Ku protein [Burkholderiaceae bacterium]
MARAISGGTISFGLVSIPVQLYSATQASAGVSFNMLHAKCGTRVKQQYICPLDNEIVPRDQMVKGYEFAKDQYVTFTNDELKAMEEKATQTIDIAQFVPAERIDPVYFDKAYYLGPEKGGEKAYRLLAEVMRETKRVAVARYAARGKQYIVMLRAADGAQGGTGIVMQTLLYGDEVRSFSEVPIGDATLREGELNLAKQLVDQIASETFDPNDYHDDVRERIQADIERKVQGQEIAAPAPTQEPARVIDLMEALKASLGAKAKATAAEAATSSDEAPDAGGIATRRPARRATGAAPAAKAEPRKRAAKR